MGDTYVECLVARKPSVGMRILKVLLIVLTAFFVFIGLAVSIGLLLAVVSGVLAYVVHLQGDIEYEYLYLDHEISVDRIMAKSRRKRVATYETERLEILAPMKSWHLDDYKNRTAKTVDYSTGIAGQPETRYVMFYNGDTRVVLEPTVEFVKAVQSIAPRKVFLD